MIAQRSAGEIDAMRVAGGIVADALKQAALMLAPGVTTGEIDQALEKLVIEKGGKLLFKGYHGFPAGSCISVNEEVVHGIPGRRVIASGDIVSVDIGASFDGWCGDAARTFEVGNVSDEKRRLLEATKGALEAAVASLYPGMKLVELSRTVQDYIEARGFSVVRNYVGHGIGHEMHEDPQVPNFVDGSVRQATTVLPEGCVLAIEPMVNAGSYDVEVMANGWTVVTKDRRPSAHWENTVAITADGPVVMTG